MAALTKDEAKRRLAQYGYNELPSARPKNVWRIALEVIREPMFLLLIACGTLYMLLGNYREGVILLSTIFLIIIITFYQYRKTEKALDVLKNLASPRALVLRDGETMRIAGREVVPGDIILLNEGDRIPADAEVLEAINLVVDESILTGESVPVHKIPASDTSLLFSGTLVVQGRGTALVKKTGTATRFGEIGISLKNIDQNETRLQHEMKLLIRNLGIIGIIICGAVVVLFFITRGDFIRSLLYGLSAAMAILPEEFPVVLMVFMALGSWRLSKKNVLTRRSAAIETLGSATVLCSDKTGTITQNKMEVVALYDGNEIFTKNAFKEKQKLITELMIAANQATSFDSVDPMERAITSAHTEFISQTSSPQKLLKEYAISAELLTMSRVLEDVDDGSVSVFAKGAPEAIFGLCRIDQNTAAKHQQALHTLAEQGYRVLAVARANHTDAILPGNQQGFNFSFLGLVGLEDPIRPEVPQAIKECTDAGIKVILITGDFPVTARSIALQAGLPDTVVISGDELQSMSDEQLKEEIRNCNIFARVVPQQKLRIVQALKANGEVVAMTGDGVNDAPALKAADIGIAMGNKGTDVAREASDLVLLDDNFASIVSAVRLGRRIFDNLQKAMSYILAIHIPIIGLSLMPAIIASLPVLLLPLHIVFMELIIDPSCSVAFESEEEEKGIMKRPPRSPTQKFFGMKNIGDSIFQGFLLFAMVVIVFMLSLNEGHTEPETRAIAFSSLIIGNIFLIMANLSKTRSFIHVFTEKNPAAWFILLGALIVLILVISVPSLQTIFSFSFPGYWHFVPALAGASSVLLILEIIKFRSRKSLR